MKTKETQGYNPTPQRTSPDSLPWLTRKRSKSSSGVDNKKPKDPTLLIRQHYPGPNKKNALFPITLSFVASTALATGTHLKEELFGPLAKFIKLPSTFLAILLGSVTTAGWLTHPTNNSENYKLSSNPENSTRIEVN